MVWWLWWISGCPFPDVAVAVMQTRLEAMPALRECECKAKMPSQAERQSFCKTPCEDQQIKAEARASTRRLSQRPSQSLPRRLSALLDLRVEASLGLFRLSGSLLSWVNSKGWSTVLR